MKSQIPKEGHMRPLKGGTKFSNVNTKCGSAVHKVFFLLKARRTHTGALRTIGGGGGGGNQRFFNGACERSEVGEYQQTCQNLILPGHKVIWEEAADDRQLKWKGRCLLGLGVYSSFQQKRCAFF